MWRWFLVLGLSACPAEPFCSTTATLGTAFAVEGVPTPITFAPACTGNGSATAELEGADGGRTPLEVNVFANTAITSTVTAFGVGRQRLLIHITEPQIVEATRDLVVMRNGDGPAVLSIPQSSLCLELAMLDTAVLCVSSSVSRTELFVDGRLKQTFDGTHVATVGGALWAWGPTTTNRIVPLDDASFEVRRIETPDQLLPTAFATTEHGLLLAGGDTLWAVESDGQPDGGLALRSLGQYPFDAGFMAGGFALTDAGPVWATPEGTCTRGDDGGSRCTDWNFWFLHAEGDGMWLLTAANELAHARFTNGPSPQSVQIFRPGLPTVSVNEPIFQMQSAGGDYPMLRWGDRVIGLSPDDLLPTAYPLGTDARLSKDFQWNKTPTGIDIRRR